MKIGLKWIWDIKHLNEGKDLKSFYWLIKEALRTQLSSITYSYLNPFYLGGRNVAPTPAIFLSTHHTLCNEHISIPTTMIQLGDGDTNTLS